MSPPPNGPPNPAVNGAAIAAKFSHDQIRQMLSQGVTPGMGTGLPSGQVPRPAGMPAGAPTGQVARPGGSTQIPMTQAMPLQGSMPKGMPMKGSGFVRRPNGGGQIGGDARQIEAQMRQKRAIARLGLAPAPTNPAAQALAEQVATENAAQQNVQAAQMQNAQVAQQNAQAVQSQAVGTAAMGPPNDPQQTWFDAMGVTPHGWLNIAPQDCVDWLARNGVTPQDVTGHASWLDAYASAKTGRAVAPNRMFAIKPAAQAAGPQPQNLGVTLAWAAGIAAVIGGGAYAYSQYKASQRKPAY